MGQAGNDGFMCEYLGRERVLRSWKKRPFPVIPGSRIWRCWWSVYHLISFFN